MPPCRVVLWDKDVIGMPAELCELNHGDFDGDEVHVYLLHDKASIAECERWKYKYYP